MRRTGPAFLIAFVTLLGGTSAWAQSAGILGTATDTTGAVLPGVTVEASSPALIEGVRATVTDASGMYRIVELRPGTYAVTFTLPGFRTVREENVQITTGFTATVNAALSVGALEETVMVTREAATVDTVNIGVQQVMNQEVLQALPVGQNLGAMRALIPGAIGGARFQDVGGNQGEAFQSFSVHGSRDADFQQFRDGMLTNTLIGPGNWLSTQNPATMQEMVVSTSGFGAAAQTGGGAINIVQRDGGNTFSGSFDTSFTDEALRSSNLSDALRARGVATETSIRQRYDVNGGLGGPIMRDRLWFFYGARYWVTSAFQPGNYFNATQGTPFYTPDLSRPAYDLSYYGESNAKVTWQATEKHKFTGTYVWDRSCTCFWGIGQGNTSPEAAGSHRYAPNRRIQATWSFPVTDRLMLWAGITDIYALMTKVPEGEGTENHRSILEVSRNYRYGAPGSNFGIAGAFGSQGTTQRNQNFRLSYVTGGHYLQAGLTTMQGIQDREARVFDSMSYRLLNGVPQAVDLFADPYAWDVSANYLGIHAEDQWTLDRLTLNLGLRYDGLRGHVPEQNLGAGRFVPERSLEPVRNSPDFHDINPRVGAAYDLFGNGRTALKASLGRSVVFISPWDISGWNNPINLMVTTATLTWNDLNGDFVPDCDFGNFDANGECGPISNRNFGTVVPGTERSDEVMKGWHNREYSWQGSISVDHQLRQGLAVSAGYFRTSFGNFTATQNRAVTPADFDEYCVTAPADPRLPGGGGQPICGLADVRPERFGQVDNVIVHSSRFGDQSEVYNGFTLSMNARHQGYILAGGLSTGGTVTDSCFVVNSLQDLYQCRNEESWYAKTQFKLNGVVPLPRGFQASVAFQMLPSIPLLANYNFGNAQAAASLGRPLSGGANSRRTVPLIQNNTEFSEGWNTQLDVRFAGNIRAGQLRIQPKLDVFNVFNADTVLGTVTAYGPAWQRATGVLGSRVIRLGVQLNF